MVVSTQKVDTETQGLTEGDSKDNIASSTVWLGSELAENA